MFVTEKLKSAISESEQFRKQSVYDDLMCLKETHWGVKIGTLKESLESCSDYITKEDIEFYTDFYQKYSKSLCVLPKGHQGSCVCNYGKFFSKDIAKKISDCGRAPGNNGFLFKNRSLRIHPVQVSKDHYKKLNGEHSWKNKIFLRAAIPSEYAGTNFLIATAYFDFSAVLLLQKGIEHKLDKDIEYALKERATNIVEEFEKQGIYIVDQNGQLCDPVLGYTIEPEWYSIDDDRSPNQIQFGHVNPLRPDKYMTRGMNVLPITRRGNLIQSDTPLSKVHDFIQHAYEHTRPR